MANGNNSMTKRNRKALQTQPTRQINQKGLASTISNAVLSGLKSLPRGTFAAVGGMAGPKGAAMGEALSKITGFGQYEMGGTAATFGGEVPHFVNKPDKTIIKHREFVATIKSPGTDFTNTTYDINPGNSSLFPWLSGVARSYQQYKILSMVAVYKPFTSDYAAGGGMGQVILATNYNVNDPAYTSALQMENSEYAVAVKPSMGALHPIECSASHRRNEPFYVYDPNAVTAEVSDKRFYDMGKLQLATEGLSTATDVTIGQLWVTYEIEFLKPILPLAASPAPPVNYELLPSYWDAPTFNGIWAPNFTQPGVTVGGGSGKFTITLQNQVKGQDIIVMFHAAATSATSANVLLTNLVGTTTSPGTDSLHTQLTWNSSHITGHIVCQFEPSFTGTIGSIEVNYPASTAGEGWVYVYSRPYETSS